MLKKRGGSSRALKGLSDTIERLRGAASHECDSGKQEGKGAGLEPESSNARIRTSFSVTMMVITPGERPLCSRA